MNNNYNSDQNDYLSNTYVSNKPSDSSHLSSFRPSDYIQRHLSLNIQRALVLIFIFLQILFCAWYFITQRSDIEANVASILKNTAVLEVQQFKTTMEAMNYQLQVIGNAMLLNHTVSPEKSDDYIQKELSQDWLDGVIIFRENGDFIAKKSLLPFENTLSAHTLAQNSFRDSTVFRDFRRRDVNTCVMYWLNSGDGPDSRWVIMYRAIRDPQGSYLGGVIGYFQASTMEKIFLKMKDSGFDLGPRGVIGIIERDSGMLIARMGAGNINMTPTSEDLFLRSFNSDSAKERRYVSPVDQVARQGVFISLNDQKWILAVGMAERDILYHWNSQVILASTGIFIMSILQWMLLHYVRTNFVQRELLAQEARRDPLTGLSNRRYFDEWAQTACSQARRHQVPLCVLNIDIDFFKKINDIHGHHGGDAVLRYVAQVLREMLRTEDIAVRFGGEEFVIALLYTNIEAANKVAERIRIHFATHEVEFNGQKIRFTASIGLARMTPEELDAYEGIYTTLARADQALYCAKQGGRNRVIVAD